MRYKVKYDYMYVDGTRIKDSIDFHRLQEQSEDRVLTAAYGEEIKGFQLYELSENFHFHYGGILPEVKIAYETWGTLNEAKDNAIILHGGLSASSHAKSHQVAKLCRYRILVFYSHSDQKPLQCRW